MKLCGFVEQCCKSKSQELRSWAFSKDVTLKMFNFYVEWNESDNHRSMKLVLDLLPQLIKRNPDEQAAQVTKGGMLATLVSIIAGRSSKPLAKSAIKVLDHLLIKNVVSLQEIRTSYIVLQDKDVSTNPVDTWGSLFSELFQWMRLHFVCPTAGRFIVTLYCALRRQNKDESAEQVTIETWRSWLLEALTAESSILESIKNYIFLPLFKAGKSEALDFLKRMNDTEAVEASSGADINLPALLQLAALETGKKVGLVEEPGKAINSLCLVNANTRSSGR